MKYTRAYRITYCPRYDDLVENSENVRENLFAQVTLINAVRYLSSHSDKCGIELRFVADRIRRCVHAFLLISNNGIQSTSSDVLERLLPFDYGWRRLPLDRGQFPEPRLEPGEQWHCVDVKRRCEFVDLPGSSSQLYQNNPDVLLANGGLRAPELHMTDFSGILQQGRTFPPLLPLTQRQRWQTHEITQLCVPFLAPIQDASPDRRRFCQELQRAAPCVVSLSLHPVSSQDIANARMISGALRPWMQPFLREFRNSRMGSSAEILSTFDRFFAPVNNLSTLSMRVAAPDQANALSIAHAFEANLGGSRSFTISPNYARHSLEDIGAPPQPASAEIAECLADAEIQIEEREYIDFVETLPLVYDLSEAALILRLPYGHKEGLPGIETRLTLPFHPVNQPRMHSEEARRQGQVRLGTTQLNNGDLQEADWRCIALEDLTKHALIVGSTGSGKSVAMQFMLREVDRNGIPFLVVEPVKTEYHRALGSVNPRLKRLVRRWNFEGDQQGNPADSFLAFDPMRLQEGVSVARHISYLKSCFQAAFPLTEAFALILENGLYDYYCGNRSNGACGFKPLTPGGMGTCFVRTDKKDVKHVFPSFDTFSSYFMSVYLKKALGSRGETEFSRDAAEVFSRRFQNLRIGPLGLAFRRADQKILRGPTPDFSQYNPFDLMLETNGVLELDALPDNGDKALVMAFILTFLYEKRQTEFQVSTIASSDAGLATPLRHVLVLEEAHRLLAANGSRRSQEASGESAEEKATSMFVDMLAEIRAYGQGLAIVEQIPTKIVPEAIKNTNLKLMLRLASKDDREALGEAMNFDESQKRFVTNLKTGQCVAYADDLDTPLMLTVPAQNRWSQLFH